MRLTNRNSLALFYSSFVFGSLAVPYYYVALGILIPNPLTIMLQIFLLLAASTTLLLLTLITRTRVEQVLANRLAGFFGRFWSRPRSSQRCSRGRLNWRSQAFL